MMEEVRVSGDCGVCAGVGRKASLSFVCSFGFYCPYYYCNWISKAVLFSKLEDWKEKDDYSCKEENYN